MPPISFPRISDRPMAFKALSLLLLPFSLTADPATDAYRQAHACLASNRFAEAAERFEAAAATTNAAAAAAAWLGRGEALFGAKRFDGAIAAYDRLLSAFPDSPLAPNALCGRGFAEAQAGRLPEALATFKALADRFPGHALAATAGASAGAISRTLAARERQRAAAALARDTASINAPLSEGKFAEAGAAAERFLLAHPDAANLADVRLLAADCALRAKNFPNAQDAYRRFLTLHPGHAQAPRAWLELGKALRALGRHAEAADAFGRAADLPQAAQQQAECLSRAGRHEEAFRLYEALARASTNSQERARMTLAMGDCCAALQKWEEAERLFLSVETLHASEALRPVALDRLAGVYARAGQTNQADRARSELLRRFPAYRR